MSKQHAARFLYQDVEDGEMRKCGQLGMVHTTPDILETPRFFTQIRVDGALDLYEERFHREKVRFQWAVLLVSCLRKADWFAWGLNYISL